MRNDLTPYDRVPDQRWPEDVCWVRPRKNLLPLRLNGFGRHVDWSGKDVLDLGYAEGSMAAALAVWRARVSGIDPASGAVEAASRHSTIVGLTLRYDVGVGEDLSYAGCNAAVCVDVLEDLSDLNRVLAEDVLCLLYLARAA